MNLNQSRELRIDYQGKHLKRVLVNSDEIPMKIEGGRILIPQKYLKESSWNNITIEYTN